MTVDQNSTSDYIRDSSECRVAGRNFDRGPAIGKEAPSPAISRVTLHSFSLLLERFVRRRDEVTQNRRLN